MEYEYLHHDFTEDTVMRFFDEYLLQFSDIWTQIEYRVFAGMDVLDNVSFNCLGAAIFLLPENQASILPTPQVAEIGPFKFSAGNIPFSKEVFKKLIAEFIQLARRSKIEFDTENFFLLGEPDPRIEYTNLFETPKDYPYSLSFPIILQRNPNDSEVAMMRTPFDVSRNQIKRQMGTTLLDTVRKFLGASTPFFKPGPSNEEKIFLTIHAPVWIKFSNTILSGDIFEARVEGPSNIVPTLAKAVLNLAHSQIPFEHISDASEFPLVLRVTLPSGPRKLQLKLFSKGVPIQDIPVYNSGLLNPITRLLEKVRGLKFKKRILNLQAEKPGRQNRFEQIVIDLFSSLGFICVKSSNAGDKADIVAFFEKEKGLYECFVIESSESTKEHPEVNTLFERTKKLSKEIGCKAYPVFLTNASRDEIRNPKDYERVLLLTKEDALDLIGKAERNEPLHKVKSSLMAKTMFLTDIEYDIELAKPAEATLSVYLDYKARNL